MLGRAPVAPYATLVYGALRDQVVDFYAPRGGRGPVPLVVLLHGGAWRSPYDRRHISPFAAYLAGCGLAVASVEYRRGPDDAADGPPSGGGAGTGGGPRAGRWPETFDDVALAVDHLPALVEELTAAGTAGAAGRMDGAVRAEGAGGADGAG
ncbi:alpha/beta hydrolase, partial [Streptomyces sp. 8N706]|uniref:alpha/beta hydrolase n=1 Tax=Streptomyces sp. 8N706 TaxID=3457416 RepID=UPI003FD0E7D3